MEFAPGRKDTITNPLTIAEILSELYRSISTLREYILIFQTEMYVEQYCKTEDNKWLLSEYNKAVSMLSLTSILFKLL